MLRTVSDALLIAVRIASSTLVELLPTISLNRYTWSLTLPPRPPPGSRPWHDTALSAPGRRTPPGRFGVYGIRTSGGPEYVVRRTPGMGLLRRLRNVRHRRPRSSR